MKNEFNDRQHVEGTLSMARSADPDSAGSQFFVCLGREHCQHLDNQYTAFGQVIEGMDGSATRCGHGRSGSSTGIDLDDQCAGSGIRRIRIQGSAT